MPMPIAFVGDYSQPFFAGSATASSSVVPGTYQVAVNGRPYMLNTDPQAIERAMGGRCPRLTEGQIVHPLVLKVHGGDGDRDSRFDALQTLLRHPGPALLVGTVDAINATSTHIAATKSHPKPKADCLIKSFRSR